MLKLCADLKSELGFTEVDINTDVGGSSHPHKKKVRVPIMDWSKSEFFEKIISGIPPFNPDNDPQFFRHDEIDYILNMIKDRYRDFKENDMTRPFYMKGVQTLKYQLEGVQQENLFHKICKKYNEVCIENTFKLLIRCKMMFQCYELLTVILQDVARHEILMK